MIPVPSSSSRFPFHSDFWRPCSLIMLLAIPSLSIAPAILKKLQNWWYDRVVCRTAKRSLGKPFPFFMFWTYSLYGQKFVWKRYDGKYWYPWTAGNILHLKLNQFNVIIFFPFLRLFLVCLFIILFQSNLFSTPNQTPVISLTSGGCLLWTQQGQTDLILPLAVTLRVITFAFPSIFKSFLIRVFL